MTTWFRLVTAETNREIVSSVTVTSETVSGETIPNPGLDPGFGIVSSETVSGETIPNPGIDPGYRPNQVVHSPIRG